MKYTIIIFIFLGLYINCSDSPMSFEPTARGSVRSGWRYFEKGEYDKASKKFNAAFEIDSRYAPAFNGLIWNYMMLDSLSQSAYYSSLYRNLGVTVDTADSDTILAQKETTAAIVLANYYNDNFSNCANAFEVFEDSAWTNFVFSHNTKIDETDIRYAAAIAYFYQQNYLYSAMQIQKIEPAWQYNPLDDSLSIKIFNKIDSLRLPRPD